MVMTDEAGQGVHTLGVEDDVVAADAPATEAAEASPAPPSSSKAIQRLSARAQRLDPAARRRGAARVLRPATRLTGRAVAGAGALLAIAARPLRPAARVVARPLARPARSIARPLHPAARVVARPARLVARPLRPAGRALKRRLQARPAVQRGMLALGVIITAGGLIALIVAIATGGTTEPGPRPPYRIPSTTVGPRPQEALFAGVPQSGAVLGSPRAPVTLQEFADLQCQFCADYELNVLPALIRQYVRTGEVRMVLRTLDLIGSQSLTAEQYAAAAGLQDRMWDFVQAFYADQGTENSGYVTPAFLQGVAWKVPGLSPLETSATLTVDTIPGELEAASQLANANGIDTTPSFLIGPTGGSATMLNYGGAVTTGAFTGPIDAALAQARTP